MPDNKIISNIINELGHPIVSTSIRSDDDFIEYITNAELIFEEYENLVDFAIDGGAGGIEPSTIIDCTGDEIEIIREGKGKIDLFF